MQTSNPNRAFLLGKFQCTCYLEDQARKFCARILAYRDVLEGDLDQAPLYHRLFGIMNRAFARLERRAESRRQAYRDWLEEEDNRITTQMIAKAVDAEAFPVLADIPSDLAEKRHGGHNFGRLNSY